jgi:eukaryotic-like serine/threonine-protein kinase
MEQKELRTLEALFHALIEIPRGPERAAAALRLSGDDVLLARNALALVESDEQATAANDDAQRVATEPRSYGNYRTVRLLGTGGMGAVYLAARADGQFQQTVAIKVIAPYVAGEAFRERFLAERQILAGLNHPNIARLLDGGVSADGMPYLVLEYVDGQPLDQYCDTLKMGIRARLELVRKLCEPIAYAHRNLVVHRDLKPSNILVPSDGRPMLLDFGTAKLLVGNGTDTATASPLLTLRYSSPEQRSRASITTSTDIFSLGVILYELLTGAWPFGDPKAPEQLPQRFARESPMTLPVTSVTEGAALTRATSLKALKNSLAGDLTSILGKALAPVPDERYESAQALSADIGNWLDGKPVSAKPATFAYQAYKFARRNFVPVALTAIALFALLSATAVAIYQARLARDRYTDLRLLTTSLLFELKDAINDMPGSTPAQQILVSRVLKNLDKMAHSSEDPDLQAELGEAFRQLGELQGSPYSQNLGDSKGALESLAKARAIAEAGLMRHPKDVAWLHLAGFSEATTSEVYYGSNQTAEAIAHATKATAYYESLAPLTKNPVWLADAASAYGVLGDMLGQNGTQGLADPTRAAVPYRRAIQLHQAALDASPGALRSRRGVAVMRMKLGDLVRPTDPESALNQYRNASTVFDGLPPEELNRPANKRIQITFLRKTGNALRDLQEWAAASETLQQPLAFFNSEYAADTADKRAMYDLSVMLNDLADLYFMQEDNRRALPLAERNAQLMTELLHKEPGNPVWQLLSGWCQVRLATLLDREGNATRALPFATEGLKELARLSSPPRATPRDLQLASQAYLEVEPKALRDPQRAVVLARRYLAVTRQDNITGQYTLALALQLAGRTEEAKATAQKALALLAPVRGGRIPYVRKRLEALL